jgi:hypothetical protein
MKSAIPAIRNILVNNAGVLALLKSGANPPRVYLMRAEQFTAGGDAIINEVFGSMMDTLEEGSTGFFQSRISIECRAPTYSLAVQIADAVKAALLPFRGASLTAEIHGIMHAGDYSDYSDEGTVFRQIADFRIHYA